MIPKKSGDAGHFLKIRYPIRSKGDGADDDFDFMIAFWISSWVKRLHSML